MIIDGAREVLRAVEAGVRCVEAFVCEELCNTADSERAVDAAKSSGAEVLDVTPDVYAKLAFGERDDGIVVVAETPRRVLDDLQLPAKPLVAVLEGIEKPGNLGAILRVPTPPASTQSSSPSGRTDLFNPNTIRAVWAPYFGRTRARQRRPKPWLGSPSTYSRLSPPGRTRTQATPNADLRGGVAIVLGSEADGLSDAWGGANVTRRAATDARNRRQPQRINNRGRAIL